MKLLLETNLIQERHMGKEIKSQGLGPDGPEFKSEQATLLTVYLWANYSSSQILSFPICNMDTIALSFLTLS